MTLSISAIETSLLDKIFAKRGQVLGAENGLQMPDPNNPGKMITVQPPELPSLDSLESTQKLMTQYAFKDFLQYFLDLEKRSKELAQRQATFAPAGVGPLYAKPLHLNIEIERYSQLGGDSSTGSQPVSVQKAKNDNAATSRIEIRTPQIHSDGAVTYNVTVVKLAVSIEDMQPRPDLAQGAVVAKPLVTASGTVVSDDLEDFFEDSPFGAETIWEFEHADAMELIEQEEKISDWKEEQKFRLLVQAAYNVIKYMQAQKVGGAFELTEEDQKLIEACLRGERLTEATRNTLISFLKKKKIELEMLRKEQAERKAAAEDSHKIAAAQETRDRLINMFDLMINAMKEQKIDPKVLAGMIAEIDRLNLQQGPSSGATSGDAAAAAVATAGAGV